MNTKWNILTRQREDQSLLEILIKNRNLSETETKLFLEPDFIKGTYDPFWMSDMEQAVETILLAVKNEGKIGIFGDYDVDGITSVALLIKFFKFIGYDNVIYKLPDRVKDGYGLKKGVIDYFLEQKVDLLITADCGITNVPEVQYAQEKGLQVVITDHHTPLEKIPQAQAVVNPKKKRDSYPFKDLCGAAVAYKLCQAVGSKVLTPTKLEQFLKWNLDLVAIATVADCVPLVGENRIITKYGLMVLNQTKNIGLKLVNKYFNQNKKISAFTIGFIIGPRLNAPGRIKTPDLSLQLLLSESEEEAMNILEQVNNINTHRQTITAKNVTEAKQQFFPIEDKDKILIAAHRDWHQGVIGLIAGRLTEYYARPSIIFTEYDDYLVGSARSPEFFNVIQAIDKCGDLLEHYGGHRQAAGLSLKKDKFPQFIASIKEYSHKKLQSQPLEKSFLVETYLNPAEITMDNYNLVQNFEPFGIGNQEPVFAIKNCYVYDVFTLGKKGDHLKLQLDFGDKKVTAVGFNIGEYKDKFNLRMGDRIDVLVKMTLNHRQGVSNLELQVVDLKK